MNYNAKHNAKDTIGICGINVVFWGEILEQKNINPNSLKACLVVYKELLHKHKSKRATIKAYKGIESKSNMWIIDKTIEIEKGLK